MSDIHRFRYVLPDEFVCVFHRSLLPEGIRIGEKDGDFQLLGDQLVLGKLTSVVSGNGLEVFLVWFEESYSGIGDTIGILAVGELFHEQESGHTLRDGQNEVFSVLDEVHLEMAKLPVLLHLNGTLVDGDPVGYVGDHCCRSIFSRMKALLLSSNLCRRWERSFIISANICAIFAEYRPSEHRFLFSSLLTVPSFVYPLL